MSAPAIGYSPWELYGPCDCGAAEGEPCRTGPTGAARLVVHHARRPVDDTTGVGFIRILTRDERELLAAVHRWAREKVPGSLWPRWERSYLAGMWKRHAPGGDAAETAEVAFGDCADGKLHVQVRASRYGEYLLDEYVRPRSVREAVDLLVVWGLLPAEFLSLHRERRGPTGAEAC